MQASYGPWNNKQRNGARSAALYLTWVNAGWSCHCVGSAADNSLVFLGQSRITAAAASDELGEMFHFNKMNINKKPIVEG